MVEQDSWDEGKAKRIARSVLIVVGLLTAMFVYFIVTNLSFDYDFEKFFPEGDEATETFKQHRDQFGSDNDFVLIGLKSESGILNKETLEDIEELSAHLEEIPYVENVVSLANLKRFKKRIGSITQEIDTVDLVRYKDDSLLIADSEYVLNDDRYVGTFISKDGKSATIFVKTEDFLSKAKCDELADRIPEITKEFDDYEINYAGRSIGQSYYIELMQQDLIIFISASIVLLIVFLYFAYKASWGIIVPLTIVLLGDVWVVGFMAMINEPVNMVLTMLPTIIFVVGMSDVVHMVSKYLEELRLGKPKLVALRTSFREIGLATLLTSLTTAIGFATLLTSTTEPIRIFGLYTAIGVLIAFVLAFSVLPSVFVLMKVPEFRKQSEFWQPMLRRSFRFVIRHPKTCLAVSATITAIGVFFALQIKQDNYILEDLRPSNKIRKQFTFFEENFGGVRPFEMNIHVKDTNYTLLDRKVVDEVDKIERYLKSNYGVGGMMSLNTVIKSIHETNSGGADNSYKLADTKKEFKQDTRPIKLMMKRYKSQLTDSTKQIDPDLEQIVGLIDTALSISRITGRIGDLGSVKLEEMNNDLAQFVKDSVNTDLVDYSLTGTAHLIDINNRQLSKNMLVGLLMAFVLVAIIMGLLFRSIKMMLISLIPNIIPLVLISGVLGASGTDLKVSISIIFTIAFGICVDDTIHFMSKLKIEKMKGRSDIYALKRAYLSTGRAIIITSLILCSGFLMLVFSEFLGTFYVGYLISITLFIAVIADLFLLPALYIVSMKKSSKN